MILDGHVHIARGDVNREILEGRMKTVGIQGGILLSLPPASQYANHIAEPFEERLENLFLWVGDNPDLYPFFWIDPLEKDALAQVESACKRGVKGFKIICNHFYPSDPRALEVYQAIALQNRPILFHSGILWDGQPSSNYNRPANFEALIEISGLRFALAHISWPWCDENLAVYGKIQHALANRADISAEMFIDTTPGTPPIYRNEALTKVFTIGYEIEDNVFFGTDCIANDYSSAYASQWMDRDNAIYDQLHIKSELQEKIYWKNLDRFIHGDRKYSK